MASSVVFKICGVPTFNSLGNIPGNVFTEVKLVTHRGISIDFFFFAYICVEHLAMMECVKRESQRRFPHHCSPE